jgi:hypothetical protein
MSTISVKKIKAELQENEVLVRDALQEMRISLRSERKFLQAVQINVSYALTESTRSSSTVLQKKQSLTMRYGPKQSATVKSWSSSSNG